MTAAIAATAPAIPPPIAVLLPLLSPLRVPISLLDLGVAEEEAMVAVVVTLVEVPLVGVAVAVRDPEVVARLMILKEFETNTSVLSVTPR